MLMVDELTQQKNMYEYEYNLNMQSQLFYLLLGMTTC